MRRSRPEAELKKNPVPNAIAIVSLAQAIAKEALPECADRFAVTLNGSESNDDLAKLKDIDAIMLLIQTEKKDGRESTPREESLKCCKRMA